MSVFLKDLLDKLLRDVNRAQVASNHLTLQISKKYKDDPILKYLPIPNAELSSLDLDLHFVYAHEKDLESNNQKDAQDRLTQDDPLPRLAVELAHRLSGTAASHIVHRAKDLDVDDETSVHTVLENLQGIEFQRHLGGKIESILRSEVSSLLDEDIDVLVSRVLKQLNALLDEQVYRNSSITKHIGEGLDPPPDRRGLDSEVAHIISEDFARVAAQIERLIHGDTRVIVDPAVLEKLPQQVIQSLKLNINLRNYKWIRVKSGDLELLPE